MNRAGATDTTTEPSTSETAKGVTNEAPLVRATPAPPVRGDATTGTETVGTGTSLPGAKKATDETNAIANAADSSVDVKTPSTANDAHALPLVSDTHSTPTKMGTNLYDVSWSLEEQSVLEKGLETFPESAYGGLWRYVKIAAHLPAKGVRDVALRVRWMKRKQLGEKGTNKRRKASAGDPSANAHLGAGAGSIPGAGGEKKALNGAEIRTERNAKKSGGDKGGGAEGRRRGPNPGSNRSANVGATGTGRPRSVFSMPMPGSGEARVVVNGAADALGGAATISNARGGGGHILGGRVQGGPPGYGAMGGGMGTGVLPVPGVPGYAHHPPGMPPGMYPHAYPLAGMPPGMPPPGAAPPSAHVFRVPPPAAPSGALEDHGGVEITAGVGAIDRRLYGRLVSNGAIIARLRDDDAARDGSASLGISSHGETSDAKTVARETNTALLSPKERISLLTEFRDTLLDILETMRVTGGIMQRMPPLPVAVDGALASVVLPPPKTKYAYTVLDASGSVAPSAARRDPSAMTFVPMTNGKLEATTTTTTGGSVERLKSTTSKQPRKRSKTTQNESKSAGRSVKSPKNNRGNKEGRGGKK
jgi:hypothetical protein